MVSKSRFQIKLFRIQIFTVDIINALMLYVLMSLVAEIKLKPEKDGCSAAIGTSAPVRTKGVNI